MDGFGVDAAARLRNDRGVPEICDQIAVVSTKRPCAARESEADHMRVVRAAQPGDAGAFEFQQLENDIPVATKFPVELPAHHQPWFPGAAEEPLPHLTHLLHHDFGSCPDSTGYGFLKRLVTRFFSVGGGLAIRFSMSVRWVAGQLRGLKNLARHTGCLAAKHIAHATDGNLHFHQIIEVPDDVGPLQLPLFRLVHGNAGRSSNRAKPKKVRTKVIRLIRQKYSGKVGERFGPTLAAEQSSGSEEPKSCAGQKQSDGVRVGGRDDRDSLSRAEVALASD